MVTMDISVITVRQLQQLKLLNATHNVGEHHDAGCVESRGAHDRE